jgi:GAF domain-containing protein/PAS domain-containing protein
MSLQYTLYVWPLVLGALLSGALVVLAARRRHVRGATSLAWLMAAITFWLLCYALQVSSADLPTITFWSNAAFLSIAFVPLPWLTFALEYSGRGRWITPRNVALLAVVPSVTQFMVWTNEALGLFRTDLALVARGSILTMESSWGPWFWVHTAYSYLSIVLGVVLLALMLARSSALYRRQAITLLAGALVPLLANALFLFVFKQSFILDPTPFTLLVTGVTFAVGLFRFQLLDVVPAARDAVIEGMGDAVLVLDAENRIVDLNPAAQHVLGRTGTEAIGRPAREVLAVYGDLLDRYGGLAEGQAEIDLEDAGHFDIRLSVLYDRHEQPTGRLIVLRDITDRKRAEEALERWVRQFRVVSEVAHEIAAGHELDDLLGRVVGLVQDRFEAYQVAIYLVGEGGQQATLQAVSGEGSEELLGSSWEVIAGAGAVGDVLRRGVPRVAVRPETGAEHGDRVSPDARSEAALPLHIGQRTIGVLDVYSTAAEPFDETALAVLQAVADQLAMAVENARLLQQMASSVREMERTYRGQDLEAWRSLSGKEGQALGYRYRQQRVQPAGEISPEAERALRHGQPVVARTGDGDATGTVAVPIVLREQTIGALNLRFQRGQVTPDTVTLVQEVANRLALTLESARLYRETQRSAAREQMIAETTSRMREPLDLDNVLQTAVAEMRRVLDLDSLAVRLTMPGGSDDVRAGGGQ